MNLKTRAKQVLEKNTREDGIRAGSSHFNDLWARDALYACWGALEIGMHEAVKATLRELQHHQKNGQIPLRIGTLSMKKAFLHLPTKTGAVYTNDKNNDPALDPNSLYLITLEKYLDKTKDKELRDTNKIAAAAEWLLDRNNHGLLTEGSYASWDDALKKNAPSIYNNALAYAALKAAARMTNIKRYNAKANQIKQSSKRLYNGAYYDAWEEMTVMDVAGNLLAIHTGLADKVETETILYSLDEEKRANNDLLPKTNYPRYPRSAVYTPFYFVGMGDYHNQGPYWSWIAALEALVREDKREAIHKQLEEWSNASNGIHEIYSKPGTPTKRLFYQSETDFSWTAGLILAAQ